MVYVWKSTSIHRWLTEVPKTFPSFTTPTIHYPVSLWTDFFLFTKKFCKFPNVLASELTNRRTIRTTEAHGSEKITLTSALYQIDKKTELLSRATLNKNYLSRMLFHQKAKPIACTTALTQSELLFKYFVSRMECKWHFSKKVTPSQKPVNCVLNDIRINEH